MTLIRISIQWYRTDNILIKQSIFFPQRYIMVVMALCLFHQYLNVLSLFRKNKMESTFQRNSLEFKHNTELTRIKKNKKNPKVNEEITN